MRVFGDIVICKDFSIADRIKPSSGCDVNIFCTISSTDRTGRRDSIICCLSIGPNDFENSKAYLIRNKPIGDGNYIQNGRRHTVFGMEYDNQAYGFQVSFGANQILHRKKESGVWGNWQRLTIS